MAARAWRALATSALALTIVLTMATGATATFAVTRGLPLTAVSTGTVEPPTNVAAVLGSCSNARWMSVTVSWTASPSRGVSGYLIVAFRNDGSVLLVAQAAATDTSVNTTVDKLASGSTTVTFTVTTQTTYGWTAESVRTGSLTC